MRKKLLYTFLIILLLANVFLLYMIVNKPQKGDAPKKDNFLTKELSFSSEQEERFFMLDRIHRNEMRQIDKELRDLRNQVFSSFGKKDFPIDSIANRMGVLDAEKNKELFAFFTRVRKICNESQAIKFDGIIKKVLQKKGPKPPRGGKRGEGPPPRKDF